MTFAVLTSHTARFAHIQQLLAAQNADCAHFHDALSLLHAWQHVHAFQLILIDARHFSTDGYPVLLWRDHHAEMSRPVLVFGPFAQEGDISQAFEAGADDVIASLAFDGELMARVWRLAGAATSGGDTGDTRLAIGPYELCRLRRSVTVHGESVLLTPLEFAIVSVLFASPGVFLSRQKIAMAVWGQDASVVDRSIDQHIYQLRKKLGFGAETGVSLDTVYGRGYLLAVHPEHTPRDMEAPALVRG